MLPRPRALAPADGDRRIERLLVLSKGENPTFSYYIENRLQQPSCPPSVVRSIDEGSLDDFDPTGSFVVICRYIRPRQISWLERHRRQIAGIALFVDDDIAALITGRDGAWTYRAYLAYFACLPLPRLNRLLSDVWVSTPALRSRLAHQGREPRILSPSPVLADHLPMRPVPGDD